MVLKLALLPAVLYLAFAGAGAHAQATHPYANKAQFKAQAVQGQSETPSVFDKALDAARSVNLRAGLDVHQETYTEYGAGGKLMQEKGTMYGLVLGADIPVGRRGLVALEGLYATGESDYTGSYVGGTFGSAKFSGQDRKLYSLSGTYKYRFDALVGTVTGIGLDYRVLTDRLDQAGPGGYKRVNKSLWAHVTMERELALTNAWAVTPQVKVSYLLKGTQTAEFMGGYKFKQDKGYGYELGLDFTRTVTLFSQKQAVSIKPYYRYKDVKDSDVVGGMYEPRNKTKEIGVQVSVKF